MQQIAQSFLLAHASLNKLMRPWLFDKFIKVVVVK